MFDEAEQLNSEDREIWHNKGMCYLYLKQYDKSIDCFETANSIQRHENTFTQMGRVYRLLGKEEEALAVYMDALESTPEAPDILTAIGLLHLKLGNNAKAFEFLGNSLTYDPKNAKTILAAGSIIQDNQDMDVALVKYRIAATQTPNSSQLWNNIGMCFFGKGKYVAAVACLKRAGEITVSILTHRSFLLYLYLHYDLIRNNFLSHVLPVHHTYSHFISFFRFIYSVHHSL